VDDSTPFTEVAMRSFPLAALCCVSFVAFVQAEEPRKGFVVHEWGVFRVYNDVELANADMRAIWQGLPKFFYGQVSGRDLPKFWRNVEAVDKPVIFFHTSESVEVELRIDFPGGVPAVWWPGTETPAVQYGKVTPAPKEGEPFRFLAWRLYLKEPPKTGIPMGKVELARVDDKHWVKTLREVKAEDVYVRAGEQYVGCEREKFVYYDGLLPRGKWVEITVNKEKIAVASRAGHPVFDLTVVDRRKADHIRVARLAKLESGAKVAELEFKEADAKGWPASALDTLIGQLKEGGLFEDEAKSLAELWKQELFLTPGLTLLYCLPQEEYERLLPMKMKPKAEKLVRVGLVQHPHCEPDLAERVAALVNNLSNEDFDTRERAQKQLDELGRAAFIHLVRMRKGIKAPEAKRRLEEILEKYDVEKAIKK
jgi:hypothetical protein